MADKNEVINEQKLGETIDQGLKVLQGVFRQNKPTKEELGKARLASSVLSTGARLLATKSSMLSLRLRVSQVVFKTPEEKREYLKISSPELKLLKGGK